MTHGNGVWCRNVVLHLMSCVIPQSALPSRRPGLRPVRTWGFLAVWAFFAIRLVAAASIELEAEAAQRFYREGADNEIFVEARISTATHSEPGVTPAAPAGTSTPSVPLRNIVFVLDRSGSMDGDRINALREAVAGALGTLGERDIVSIVLFGSEVETVLEAQRVEQARAALAALSPFEAVGGAALYEGLSQGAAQGRRFADAGSINQLILVTDGPSTKGPREREDFVRLVESFVRDGLTVSTIGLGDEFEEDVLAEIARAGSGRFRFATSPEELDEMVRAEVAPARAIVARDAILTIEFRPVCDRVAAYGAPAARVHRNTVTARYPRLLEGQSLSVVASGELSAFATIGIQRDLVRARLRWTDPVSGEPRELSQGITIRFSLDSRDVVETFNLRVYQAAAAALATEGLQDAIEKLDSGDPRRAVRELRRARAQLLDINNVPRDPQIATMAAQFDAYLAEVQVRGMSAVDRKILRSGLFNRFEMPVPGEEPPVARP